ncbi:hypothetical protein D3C76_1327530 [compost metagenome]
MSKTSRATRLRFSSSAVFTARIAQVRSASLIRATRTSSTMATSILRRFSTWPWVPITMDLRGLRLSLIAAMRCTPSISLATTGPKRWLTVGNGIWPSRTPRYNTAATSESWSSLRSARISAISRPVRKLELPSVHRFLAALACCSASRANSQASFKASRSSARSTLTA